MQFGHEVYANAIPDYVSKRFYYLLQFNSSPVPWSSIHMLEKIYTHLCFVSCQRITILQNQQTIEKSQAYIHTEFNANRINLAVHTLLLRLTGIQNKIGEFWQVISIRITFISKNQVWLLITENPKLQKHEKIFSFTSLTHKRILARKYKSLGHYTECF